MEFPAWLSAVSALLVIAAILGAAVSVYKTTILSGDLKAERERTDALRGDITDRDRRLADKEADHKAVEAELRGELGVCRAKNEAAADRITVLEDLLTKRQDDKEIREEIAAVREVVDTNVITQLSSIHQSVETLATVVQTLASAMEDKA